MLRRDSKLAPKISDASVQAKTGKTWSEWFDTLDKSGARKMTHTQVAAHLYNELGCPGWWNQMVANTYQQARGLRQKHQTPQGYQISRSATIAVAIGELYQAWQNKTIRARWLSDPDFVVRKATVNKSLRITWIDNKTSVEVFFLAKGEQKTQLVVQHSKLSDARAAERMKTYWGKQLVRLKELLEE